MVTSAAPAAAIAAVLAASSSETETPAQGETQEVVETPAPVEGLDKPLNEYTTTEGLLLIIVLLLVLSLLGDFWRRCTSWL